MLEPISPEHNFFQRVMRRYDVDFVIINESLEEMGEYGWEELRDPTRHELKMWYKTIPADLQAKINTAYYNTVHDFELEATPEEVHGAVLFHGDVVYMNAKDFSVLRAHPPDGLNVENCSDNVSIGHLATVDKTRVFVSREIPTGYFLSMSKPDSKLNWRPSPGERKVRPEICPYEYDLRPLLHEQS